MNTLRLRLIIACAALGVGLGAQVVVSQKIAAARSQAPSELNQPLSLFPEKVGMWNGVDVPANPKIIADIKIDEHLNREYVHPSGEKVVLWMSFSKRSLDQYHYPTVCMAGSGWTEDESARERLAIHQFEREGEAEDVPAMSMSFSKNDHVELVYYWYYLIGEDSVDRFMRRSSQVARAFLRGRRNSSLTVEVFSQSPRPDRRLLDEFARSVASELQAWMPEGTDADCVLGANY